MVNISEFSLYFEMHFSFLFLYKQTLDMYLLSKSGQKQFENISLSWGTSHTL